MPVGNVHPGLGLASRKYHFLQDGMNAVMLVRQHIVHIDVYMLYIAKEYREAQLVPPDGRANGHVTPDLSGTRRVGFHTLRYQTSSLQRTAFVFLRLLRLDFFAPHIWWQTKY